MKLQILLATAMVAATVSNALGQCVWIVAKPTTQPKSLRVHVVYDPSKADLVISKGSFLDTLGNRGKWQIIGIDKAFNYMDYTRLLWDDSLTKYPTEFNSSDADLLVYVVKDEKQADLLVYLGYPEDAGWVHPEKATLIKPSGPKTCIKCKGKLQIECLGWNDSYPCLKKCRLCGGTGKSRLGLDALKDNPPPCDSCYIRGSGICAVCQGKGVKKCFWCEATGKRSGPYEAAPISRIFTNRKAAEKAAEKAAAEARKAAAEAKKAEEAASKEREDRISKSPVYKLLALEPVGKRAAFKGSSSVEAMGLAVTMSFTLSTKTLLVKDGVFSVEQRTTYDTTSMAGSDTQKQPDVVCTLKVKASGEILQYTIKAPEIPQGTEGPMRFMALAGEVVLPTGGFREGERWVHEFSSAESLIGVAGKIEYECTGAEMIGDVKALVISYVFRSNKGNSGGSFKGTAWIAAIDGALLKQRIEGRVYIDGVGSSPFKSSLDRISK